MVPSKGQPWINCIHSLEDRWGHGRVNLVGFPLRFFFVSSKILPARQVFMLWAAIGAGLAVVYIVGMHQKKKKRKVDKETRK